MGRSTPRTNDGPWIEMRGSVCVIQLTNKEVINLYKFSTPLPTGDGSIILHYFGFNVI